MKDIKKKIRKHMSILIKSAPTWINFLLHNHDNFENKLSVMTIIRNEAPYIKEWLDYHKLVGVEKFYIYDNESTDNLKEILQPYIDAGEVIYRFVKTNKSNKGNYGYGIKPVGEVYTETIKKYRNKTKWLAAIDADEFIVPVKYEKITDVLDELEKSIMKHRTFVSLAIHWVVYGYGIHYHKPDGLVTENYWKSDGGNKWIKSIINPRTAIDFFDSHYAKYFWWKYGVNENGKTIKGSADEKMTELDIQKIRINHYLTKSYEEYAERILKNRAGNESYTKREPPPFSPETEEQKDMWKKLPHVDKYPEKDDKIMEKYLPALKRLYSS
jgi:hypothetical protein